MKINIFNTYYLSALVSSNTECSSAATFSLRLHTHFRSNSPYFPTGDQSTEAIESLWAIRLLAN